MKEEVNVCCCHLPQLFPPQRKGQGYPASSPPYQPGALMPSEWDSVPLMPGGGALPQGCLGAASSNQGRRMPSDVLVPGD